MQPATAHLVMRMRCYIRDVAIVGIDPYSAIEFFSKCTRMAIMPILASEALFHENKRIHLQNATLVSIEPLDL